ncbi:MAG: hypothetical protein ACYC9S_06685 [Leptospirales bacterium]
MDVNKGANGLIVVAIVLGIFWTWMVTYVGVDPFYLPKGGG